MIAIVGPMERELAGLRCLEEGTEGGLALVLVTGVGKERAMRSMDALLEDPSRPESVLSLGFGGALREGLETGDLVLSRRLYATGEGTFLESDAGLLSLAEAVLSRGNITRYVVGDSLTVPQVVCRPAEKRRLAADTGACVANMEDFWIGEAVVKRAVPFLSARVVLDTVHQELPPFLAGLGGQSGLRQALLVIARCMARPWEIPKVMSLSRQVNVAQRRLTSFGLSFATKFMAAESCAPS